MVVVGSTAVNTRASITSRNRHSPPKASAPGRLERKEAPGLRESGHEHDGMAVIILRVPGVPKAEAVGHGRERYADDPEIRDRTVDFVWFRFREGGIVANERTKNRHRNRPFRRYLPYKIDLNPKDVSMP